VGSALRPGWRLLSPDQRLLAAVATILIAGAYAAYRINAPNPDAMRIATQAIGAGEHDALTATPAVPLKVESKPLEPETTTEPQPPSPTTTPEAPKRAGARQRPVPAPSTKHASPPQRPVPAPTTKRASASQSPVPELQASVGAIPPGAHRPAPAPLGAPVAHRAKAWLPETGQAIDVSLARCSGDLFARILCEQRVRRRFCEGHWGETPECVNGVINDHGQ